MSKIGTDKAEIAASKKLIEDGLTSETANPSVNVNNSDKPKRSR